VFEREADAGSKRADDQVEGVGGSEVVLGAGDVLDVAPVRAGSSLSGMGRTTLCPTPVADAKIEF
jgi:hypothetical protein